MDYSNFKVRFVSLLADGMSVAQIVAAFDAVAAMEEHRPQAPDALTMFLDAKLVEEKSQSTIKLYRSVLSNFLDAVSLPVSAITTAHIRHYISECRSVKGHAAVTVSNTRRILNCFFEWCVLEQLITINPVRRIAAIKVAGTPRHAMQRTELEYLRNACPDLRDKALIDFLYSTGGRVSEVCHARISDINWEKKSVAIRHGKGNKFRITYLNPEAEVSLKSYLASRTDASPYIFARVRGRSDQPLSPKTIQKAVEKIVCHANRDFSTHITPHIFRHTVATVLLRNGMPVEQVQRFLGHAKIDTTLIYAEVSDDDVCRSHAMYAA